MLGSTAFEPEVLCALAKDWPACSLARLLVESGIDRVFGVPGGQTLPLYEGIRRLPGRIAHVLMRDERSGGYAADAYARITGRVGVCDGTVGP